MKPQKKPVSKYWLLLIPVAIIAVIASNTLDTTRNIDYLKQQPETQAVTTNTGGDGHKVFICTAKGSKLYHTYTDCDILQSQCDASISETSLAEAEDAGRKKCTKCAE